MSLNRPETWPLKRRRTAFILSRPSWSPPWPKSLWCSKPEPDFARPAPLASPTRLGPAKHYTASVLAAPCTVIVQKGVAGKLAFFARIISFLRHWLLFWLSNLGAGRHLGQAALRQLTCCKAKFLNFVCVFDASNLQLKIRRIRYKFTGMFCSSLNQCSNFLQIC